jgi:hypothetical protein
VLHQCTHCYFLLAIASLSFALGELPFSTS